MENYLNKANVMNMRDYDYHTNTMNKLDRMYPDIYNRLNPHVKDVVNELSEHEIDGINEEKLNNFTSEAIRRSDFYNDPPAGHNINTAHDIARTLMLHNIMTRRQGDGVNHYVHNHFDDFGISSGLLPFLYYQYSGFPYIPRNFPYRQSYNNRF